MTEATTQVDHWQEIVPTARRVRAQLAGTYIVDTTRAVKLGTFTTPRGVVSGVFSIEGEALANFLNADANRRATLVIVRETVQHGNSSAVHGFAGNRHPTLAPPLPARRAPDPLRAPPVGP